MPKKISNEAKQFRPVVVGASLGGVQALVNLIGQFPADLPAPVLVVLHTSAEGPGLLPEILRRAGKLPAAHAVNGQTLAAANIYVAPPDYHLLVEDHRLRLTRDPKVNRSRPAVDVLFESAAETFGARIIGVLLTGSLSDGAVGLERIKQRGGVTIVQDPNEAYCAEMPLNALRKVAIDFVLPLAKISSLVNRLTRESLASWPPSRNGVEAQMKLKKAKQGMGLTCPACHGPIEEQKKGAVPRYFCRVGHSFSTESLLAAHNEAVERSLWAAVQMLEERAELLRRLASRSAAGSEFTLGNLEKKASECEMHAATIRDVFEKLPIS